MSLLDVVNILAGVTPVPGLNAAFTVFHFIHSSVKTIRANQKQLSVLSNAIAQLLATLQGEFESERLIPALCVQPLENLLGLLNDIHKFVQAEKHRSFLTVLLHADSRVSTIDMFYHRIGTATAAFQISSSINIQHMLHDNEEARLADACALSERFEMLEKNHDELRRELDINHKNMVAMMVSIERRMEGNRGDMNATEERFYSHTLQYLASTSGQHIKLEDWMISPFDVDIKMKIGAGGFGTVFKGTWNHTEVAIKMIHNESGITADVAMLRQEIDIWMTLRHPNILQFLGANTMDDKPFVVMPLLPHNAREYLRGRPDRDPLLILRDITLGLEYLHGRKICHGDLKGINVLVEDSGRALLCDFGLTRIKADINSRTRSTDSPTVSGSRNWMAPELLTGSLPKPPTDIYAFGMTIYELYTDQIPLCSVAYGDFIELVFKLDVRPEQPEEDEFPHFSNSIWELAERCWSKNPRARPTSQQIHDMIKVLLMSQTQISMVEKPQNLATPTLPLAMRPQTPLPVAETPVSDAESLTLPDTPLEQAIPDTGAPAAPPAVEIHHTEEKPSITKDRSSTTDLAPPSPAPPALDDEINALCESFPALLVDLSEAEWQPAHTVERTSSVSSTLSLPPPIYQQTSAQGSAASATSVTLGTSEPTVSPAKITYPQLPPTPQSLWEEPLAFISTSPPPVVQRQSVFLADLEGLDLSPVTPRQLPSPVISGSMPVDKAVTDVEQLFGSTSFGTMGKLNFTAEKPADEVEPPSDAMAQVQHTVESPALEELQGIDADLHYTLDWMLNNNITDILTETFTTTESHWGEMITVDLVPNGAQIQVTEENKVDFINQLVSYRLSRHAMELAALNELGSIDPKLYNKLKALLENEITSSTDLFTTTEKQSGVAISIDLVPEGSKIAVTEQNKREYVNEMISHRMTQHTRDRAALRELEGIDRELYFELTWMLDNDITHALTDLTFTTTKKRSGKVFSKDLVPNGRDIAVTEDNKQEYVSELVSHRLMEHAQRVETVNNVKFIDPELHSSLKWMLENNVTGIVDGGFTITDTRSGKLVELVPDGRSITVTEENKLEFIDAVQKYFRDSHPSGQSQIGEVKRKKSRKWYHF